MRSLKTQKKEILMIGSFGVERRGQKWKAKGVGPESGKHFTVWEEAPGKWRVNGKNSKGSRRRERFVAVGLAEAISQASVILYGIPQDTGHPNLDLATAFHRSISSGGGSQEHKQHLRQFAAYFCTWAEGRGLTHWHHLRLEHIREYVNGLLNRGLKAKTVSRYLEPIRATARFMAANWPDYYHEICARMRLPANAGRLGLYRAEDGNPSLSYAEVLDFLAWLEAYERADALMPGVMLQGICGLQLREALRLRWADVDLKGGTITIQDHPEFGERVKNLYRVRRIPLPLIVRDHLRRVRQRDGRVVPYEGNDNAYGKLLKRALRKWNADCCIAPKDLRNTLQTHAIEHAIDEGWNTYLVDRYVGHAPKSVAERHYFGDQKKRMVEVFREHVADKIDALLETIQIPKGHKTAQRSNVVPFSKASSDR